IRAARRRADVVVASFHWGIERTTRPTARQRALARLALHAGATAVIAAHPHVLQPVARPGHHRLIAYSLGNFVWSAGGGLTVRTGVLTVQLSARGVEASALRRAHIIGTRPTPSCAGAIPRQAGGFARVYGRSPSSERSCGPTASLAREPPTWRASTPSAPTTPPTSPAPSGSVHRSPAATNETSFPAGSPDSR